MRVLGVTTHEWSPPQRERKPKGNAGRRGKPNVKAQVLKELARAECLKAALKTLTHSAIAKRYGLHRRTISKFATAKTASLKNSRAGFAAQRVD